MLQLSLVMAVIWWVQVNHCCLFVHLFDSLPIDDVLFCCFFLYACLLSSVCTLFFTQCFPKCAQRLSHRGAMGLFFTYPNINTIGCFRKILIHKGCREQKCWGFTALTTTMVKPLLTIVPLLAAPEDTAV